jgi:hypothetical protein
MKWIPESGKSYSDRYDTLWYYSLKPVDSSSDEELDFNVLDQEPENFPYSDKTID